MTDQSTVEFTVNGSPVRLPVAQETPLLYVLRNDLGLKGTRFGCGGGTCSACTVIVDGRAVTSCDMPVSAVAGKQVETIESLSKGANLHPLQQAMIEEQAGQCGYCLSGIIMRAKAILDKSPAASRDDIISTLDQNLCRCGAHGRILKAIFKVANAPSGAA